MSTVGGAFIANSFLDDTFEHFTLNFCYFFTGIALRMISFEAVSFEACFLHGVQHFTKLGIC